MSYTYHISFNGSDYLQVYPSNALEITTEREEDCIFYRDKINDVKLSKAKNSSVYTTLSSYFTDKTKFNDQLEFEVYAGPRTGDAFYKGLFSISDCKWDKEKAFVEFTLRTNDRYTDILDKWDIVKRVTTAGTVSLPDKVTISSWTGGSPSGAINDFDNWTQTDNYTITGITNSSTGSPEPQCRYFSLGNLTYSSGGYYHFLIYVSAYTIGTGDNLRLMVWDSTDTDVTTATYDEITGVGWYGLRIDATASPAYAVLYSTGPGGWAITFQPYLADATQWESNAARNLVGSNSYMDDLIDEYGLSLNVKSTFFNNDALPSDAPSTIDTWITSNSNGNYVTLDTNNHFTDLSIGAGEEWDDQTPKGWSMKEIMQYLRETFQVYWYIDDDGDLRLEHRKYFDTMWSDSTAIQSSDYVAFLPEVDSYMLRYDKSLIYSREEFSQGQRTSDTDFIGLPIIYDVFETSPKIKKYNQGITTDVSYMITSGTKSGMVFYDTTYFTDGSSLAIYIVKFATGVISSTSKKNAYLSWANLHENYWSWGRMSENYNVNGSDETADSVEPFMIQEDVRFHYSSAVNWFNKISTSLGTAKIGSMVRTLDTDFITFSLLYNPYE